MPLDALCLTAVVSEIRAAVMGGRIEKIYQPGRDELVLSVRGGSGGSCRLLLSANPAHPRAQLTSISRENPDKPPMFCMLLRKYLSGARFLDVIQPPMERIVRFVLEGTNELGDREERQLVLECMGRRANLILLDGDGRITDCLRRVDSEMSQQRQVLPGLFYRLPPQQGKLNPCALDCTELTKTLAAAPKQIQTDRWVLDTFGGLSPLMCREIAWRAGGRTDVRLEALDAAGRQRLLEALQTVAATVKNNSFTPIEIIADKKIVDYTCLPVLQYENAAHTVTFQTFAALLDDFYAAREAAERVRQKGEDMIRVVTNARDRVARRVGLQRQEMAAARDREQLRRCGDLITANLYRMHRGMSALAVEDFYDPAAPEVTVPLDPLLTPQQNAAKYYKEYSKAKTAERVLAVRVEQGEGELDYLNSVLVELSLAEGEHDLAQIRQELTQTGYLRRPAKASMRARKSVSEPMEFRSTSGLRISVGKNNTQNDLLTAKLASKGDFWLHTQKIHGAHVILWTQGAQPDEKSIEEAACLAAWFSQGREGGRIAVDYTPVKYVKKPAGAKPGMVVYTVYKTVIVTPDSALVDRLRKK